MNVEPLWTASELKLFSDVDVRGQWFARGVQIDSREVLPGDLFFALRGNSMDGHDFVGDALARGAAGVIVDQAHEGLAAGDNRLIASDDPADILRQAAVFARKRMPGTVVAVTGSAGKTSVVQALRAALEPCGPTHASVRSFNNHVGVPLSLARMPRSSRWGVFEVGTSAPGEIAGLGKLVRPDIAVITTVGTAHLAGFADQTAIAREKAAIFEGMKPSGTAIISLDHDYSDMIRQLAAEAGLNVITVSGRVKADVSLLKANMTPHCSCVTADVLGTIMSFKIGQAGSHRVLNGLLVLAAVQAAGGDLGLAGLALASLRAEAGRGRVHHLQRSFGSFSVLDDSYNANPLSLAAGLEHLSMMPTGRRGRRIAVLADMAELGAEAEEEHMKMLGPLKSAGISRALTLGPLITQACQAADLKVDAFDDVAKMAPKLEQLIDADDVVFVKGANRAGLARLIENMVSESVPAQAATCDQSHAAE